MTSVLLRAIMLHDVVREIGETHEKHKSLLKVVIQRSPIFFLTRDRIPPWKSLKITMYGYSQEVFERIPVFLIFA